MNKSKEVGKKTISLNLDNLDQDIIRELRSNARQSWRELAKRLRVSPVTIMNRIRELEKNRIIQKYTVQLDYKKMGLELDGITLISVPGSKFDQVAEELIAIPEISSLYVISGEFDMIAFFRTRNVDEFIRVTQAMYHKEHVKTQTYLAVPLKEEYERAENAPAHKPQAFKDTVA